MGSKVDSVQSILKGLNAHFSPEIVLSGFNLYALHKALECDFVAATKQGYVYEVEIKRSRADFKADFKKQTGSQNRKKHDLMLQGELANYFWFAVPENLVRPDEVPDHCGLLYFTQLGDRSWVKEIKKAPRLHSLKMQPNTRDRILLGMMYKAWAKI